ncbi:hypothetical protein NQ318_016999 [Aromia moschata]|uniref:Uncharacterized protein n=1 Tax=Aromia moschata TaxID=1265417 RepID=A0AAV8YCA7_9CUCU|nr:hypothetical protein NQ318_016999 [Aromia moschata]
MICYPLIIIALHSTYAEKYFQIDDIPIENFSFENEDLQHDAVDLELVPRVQRSFPLSKEDPKEYFFSRSVYEDVNPDHFVDIPKPGGFGGYAERIENTGIRNKREAVQPGEVKSERREVKNMFQKDIFRDVPQHFKANISEVDPKSMVEEVPSPHTEKLIMEPRRDETETMRESRGATKEQWVKQEYPVRRSDHEDNSLTSSEQDNLRAPRVRFVTQGMSESAPRPEYNRYDREARSRNLNKELAWNLARDPYRDMDLYQPRYTRNYVPRSDPPYRGRQRRIIYYASLPEINRSPANADLRDGYDYRDRDRYDDRAFYPNMSYQLRKPYDKARYEENERKAPLHPLKVSTDVSVRDVNKTPERRVYSEVDRNRYPQNPSYQSERM